MLSVVWWLILCVNLTGSQDAHIYGWILFLGVSMKMFLENSVLINKLGKDYFHPQCGWSHSVMCDSLWPHGLKPARLLLSMGFSRQEYWSGLSFPYPYGEGHFLLPVWIGIIKSIEDLNKTKRWRKREFSFFLPHPQLVLFLWKSLTNLLYKLQISWNSSILFLPDPPSHRLMSKIVRSHPLMELTEEIQGCTENVTLKEIGLWVQSLDTH